jgi:6-phosphogluconolactonase
MILLPLLTMAILPTSAETTMYIGTYTQPGGSKGIYRVRLNTETGALSEAELAAEATAPSYIVVRPDGKFLYAVNEYTGGEASAFAVEENALRKLNTVKFEGGGPCHISTDPKGKWLFVSAYGGGTLTILPILPDGSIGEATDNVKNSGSGPNKGRQEGPHMHFSTPVGKFVYACDLGTDEILAFSFDSQSGKLTASSPRSAKTQPGSGPRHLVVHADGKTLYSNNEMTLGVSVFDRNTANGQLRLVQTVSTLPEGESINGKSTAAIRLHPSLKTLYVSNRGHNSVAIFGIQPDGKLQLKKVQTLDAKEPRDFAIDPSGKWLVVAGQSSDELVTYRIDAATGLLEQTGGRCKVPKPVCIAFAI